MSYMKDQMRACVKEQFPVVGHDAATQGLIEVFEAGFINGVRETLRAYGIWRDGTQVIGCLEVPIAEEFAKQFPSEGKT